MNDYRYNPFENVSTAVTITGETHVIPSVSPYTIRLDEVPLKETPSSISLTIAGSAGAEVSAAPAAGEFWPDYSTGADGDADWNTGTLLFNSADAGKAITVSYQGTGMLVDVEKVGIHVEKLTVSGNWTCPAGVTRIRVTVVSGGGAGGGGGNGTGAGGAGGYGGGAGGGGGGGGAGGNSYGAGGGGGSGGVVVFYLTVVPGQIYSYVIGAGGTPNGGRGGNSSFGTCVNNSMLQGQINNGGGGGSSGGSGVAGGGYGGGGGSGVAGYGGGGGGGAGGFGLNLVGGASKQPGTSEDGIGAAAGGGGGNGAGGGGGGGYGAGGGGGGGYVAGGGGAGSQGVIIIEY